ncbi:MAG: coagulation factor 5/8 type domain protein [Pedosphaera sp.]|nr:coagulation factor 5/8 type domain protein [Pedosphaera sp.]
MKKRHLLLLLASIGLGGIAPIFAADKSAAPTTNTPALHPQPRIPYLSPAAEAAKFVLPEGYRLELVLSDPTIQEPVAAAFDGNGRMFVAEMRSYMQDIDGTNESMTNGRVSLHWSSKHDGVYDRHTVFVDHLLLPRMILPLTDGVIVNETDSNDLWLYRDLNGDGVADKKELIYAGGTRGGNLEHQQSGLIWDLDNWLYMAVNAYRLRLHGTNAIKEPTPANGGQWGISQDNYGKLWIVNAGGELGPVNFQEPIVYGAFTLKDQFPADFREVWPLVGIADVEGGPRRFRLDDKTLNHFTATCGGEIVRGDRLPVDLRGDLLFAEPVGRLIRRAKVEVQDGLTYLRNAYDKSEFIRSTDPNFRPVNIFNAPDGTIYIVDMYRGIIQEGNWVREGSYLRKIVQQYQLDKNFGRGRIWRLVHKNFPPGPQPHMKDETPAELVPHLAHPNGWWRDTAQKLLVLRGDPSVTPALNKMARTHPNPLARIHALWTLEGLNLVDPALLREKLKDRNPQVRIAAIRISESFYKQGDKTLVHDVLALLKDRDPNVVIQVLLTANLLKWPDTTKTIRISMAANPSRGVKEIGRQLLEPPVTFTRKFTPAEKAFLTRGETSFKELCFACHGPDGKGRPVEGAKEGVTLAPPLAGSKIVNGYRDGIISVVLKGLNGPVNDKKYDTQMVPMESNSDDWIAAVTSYVRNSFGNSAPLIDSNDVARVRATIKTRVDPWTLDELHDALPKPITDHTGWKVSASHNSSTAPLAIDDDPKTRYTSEKTQTPGMWFQVELPEPTTVCGLRLDTVKSDRDYPRGYQVNLSNDGMDWSQPVASGEGTEPLVEIGFPAASAKFIRITQTGTVPGLFWSIHELQILKPGAPFKPKSAATATRQSASDFE